MPPIQAITIGPNALTVLQIVDAFGTSTLSRAAIPSNLTLAADIENWIDTTWVPLLGLPYQIVVKVLTASPISIAVWCGNPGQVAPKTFSNLP